MKTQIVIGLGFGDEGKGSVTDFLCQKAAHPIVVRFNGGHQAGHTVVLPDKKRHVFSSLGSGSLRNVPTYWSSFCTFYPPGFLKEYYSLVHAGFQPKFYLDSLSPVTTFYDVIYNRALESSRDRHGSCGLGFGVTIERHESFPKLFAQDLWFPQILEAKLKGVARYYDQKVSAGGSDKLKAAYYEYDFEKGTTEFLTAANEATSVIDLVEERSFFRSCRQNNNSLIFEGAQGILLDMDHGFFPHVTRSYTTARNAIELIQNNHLPSPSIYYVTRAYQSRHGAGPMTNEHLPPDLIVNERETNVHNDWQGNFRTGVLDLDQLRYAIRSDYNYSYCLPKHLVITCLDQLVGNIPATNEGMLNYYSASALAEEILPDCTSLLLSSSEISENIQRYNQKKIPEPLQETEA